MTQLRSQSLDLLRFPLALLVVSVHVFVAHPYIRSDYAAVQWLFAFVDAFIRDQSVPVYFFIAGYVFFHGINLDRRTYFGKIRRRVSTLLVPYLLWNTIALLYSLKALLPGAEALSDYSHDALDLSVRAILSCYWDDSHGIVPYPTLSNAIFPIDLPLWFVRDLMLLALFTPIINLLYRLPRRLPEVIMSIATIVWIWRAPLPPHGLMLLEAFVFFGWGGLLSYKGRDMMTDFSRLAVPSYVLYPLFALMIMLVSHQWPTAMALVKSVNIIIGLFFFYNVASWLIRSGRCHASKFLSSASFFIYCGHFIFIDPVMRRLEVMVSPDNALSTIAVYAATYIIIIGSLVAVFGLMRRYTPRLLALFTGGRK